MIWGGDAFWNSYNTNDWTSALLQYFLNTASDEEGTKGYLSTLTTNAEELIRTTTYNLGNVVYNTDTAITSYTNERNTASSNLHSGNYGTWSGKIGLLYPSDYGYSTKAIYWSDLLANYGLNSEIDAQIPCENSWMKMDANHTTYEWFLSPVSSSNTEVLVWIRDGSSMNLGVFSFSAGVRPCLYLISTAKILQGDGSSNSPYVVIA